VSRNSLRLNKKLLLRIKAYTFLTEDPVDYFIHRGLSFFIRIQFSTEDDIVSLYKWGGFLAGFRQHGQEL